MIKQHQLDKQKTVQEMCDEFVKQFKAIDSIEVEFKLREDGQEFLVIKDYYLGDIVVWVTGSSEGAILKELYLYAAVKSSDMRPVALQSFDKLVKSKWLKSIPVGDEVVMYD